MGTGELPALGLGSDWPADFDGLEAADGERRIGTRGGRRIAIRHHLVRRVHQFVTSFDSPFIAQCRSHKAGERCPDCGGALISETVIFAGIYSPGWPAIPATATSAADLYQVLMDCKRLTLGVVMEAVDAALVVQVYPAVSPAAALSIQNILA